MPRHHTVANANGQGDIPFTPEEESARDAEEAQFVIDRAAQETRDARIAVLRAKLDDETITLAELIELSKGRL